MRVISTFEYKQDLSLLDQLTNDDVLHVWDAFDLDYFASLLDKGQPRYVVNDHYNFIDLPNQKCYCLPLNLAHDMARWHPFSPQEPITKHTFNCMINKKQINRFLCLKLIEWFKLTNFDYSWSGCDNTFDLTDILQELNSLGPSSPLSDLARTHLLSPIQLKKKFVPFDNNLQTSNNVAITNTGTRRQAWYQCGLQTLFTHSAVSLITESIKFQKAALFTEKTAYSVLGLSLPLWIGGYQQAKEWQRMGFDSFDDIVNHDYQYYNTLIERCYYAFANNLELLTNHEKTAKLRQQLLPRLKKNRELLLENQLNRYMQEEMSTWPVELQDIMPEIIKHFNGVHSYFLPTQNPLDQINNKKVLAQNAKENP